VQFRAGGLPEKRTAVNPTQMPKIVTIFGNILESGSLGAEDEDFM
jgi:hypothetical protein